MHWTIDSSIHPLSIKSELSSSCVDNDELGPCLRLGICWENDGSPEMVECAFLRMGGGYDIDSAAPQHILLPDREVSMLYAWNVSNDGEPYPSRDDKAQLVSFVAEK